MAKNDFRVTSRICMKNVEFGRKTSKFLSKKYLFNFSIFHLNKKKLPTSILIKYVENEFSNLTSHKKKKKTERGAKT